MRITEQMHQNVLRWTVETLAALGVADLPVDVEWNDRFTSRLGDAAYNPQGSRVRFSTPLWTRASEQDRYETVVHEVCHVVAKHQNRGRKIEPHGHEWQRLMRRCGVEPKRCHNIDRTGLARTRRTVSAWCGCQEHKITPQMARRIHCGETSRACKHCRWKLRLQETAAQASPPPPKSPAKDSPQKGLRFVREGGRAFMRFD